MPPRTRDAIDAFSNKMKKKTSQTRIIFFSEHFPPTFLLQSQNTLYHAPFIEITKKCSKISQA